MPVLIILTKFPNMKSPQAIIHLSSSSLISFLFYGLAITCLTSATVFASGGGNETDYLALLSFKSMITHDPYKVLTSWNHSHYCDWSGITCGKRHKRVTVLHLKSQGLEGSLSPHVGNLSFLRKLSLPNNSFQGTIPHELGRLFRLRHLYLSVNRFSGVIPTNLSRCSNLEDLWLSENMLAGSIPKEMSLLSKLSRLVISKNNLTGGIPPFLGNITLMKFFSASGNPFGGSIPNTLGLWKSLTTFYCYDCNLYGSIPHSIFNLTLLVNFSLSENHLTGSLPSEIGNQLPNLEWLQLWGNELTGILPPSISNCSKLEYLEMSRNNFSGKLTIDFSKLRDIYLIRLHHINFHGRGEADDMMFIDSLKNCTKLEWLELENCNLIGVLPVLIGNLSDQLSFLSLGENQLFGSLPSSIGSLVGLTTLDLDANQFKEKSPLPLVRIPQFLDKWVSLEVLDLSFNDFEGEVPLVGVFCQSQNVDFQGNDFKALMYEYMPNGSVHDWLHSSANTSKLNLLQRINILRDVATALDYLHIRCETTIVHSDLKPSNILLDADMVAHVGDFGLARLLGTDLNQNSSTGVKGTIGYAPPEYGMGNDMTSSGDVYSFGILLLELMTGKKPTDDMFNEGLSIRKLACMALPDHVVDVIDGDASVLQSKEANAKKVEECLAATIKMGVSCSVDSPPQRMKIEVVVINCSVFSMSKDV
ncbi:kinase-like domain-containing protein [Tanacetum coccineum]